MRTGRSEEPAPDHRSGPASPLHAQFGRRRLLAGLVPALMAPAIVRAAASKMPARIGWLKIQGPRHTPGQLKAFREGLRAVGLVEGQDYVLVQRYGDNDEARLPGLARELVDARVGLIVATSQPSIMAAARVTKSVPVIGRMNDDPTANGMARSLGRPGGNVTGVYAMTDELNPKRLALLKEVAPSVRSVGVLLRKDWPNAAHAWAVALAAAQRLGVDLVALDARSSGDLAAAFAQRSVRAFGGIMTFRNPTVVTYLKIIAEQSRQNRLPAVFDAREYVDAGGLMSYGPNIKAIYRQLATYAAQILKGATASQIPIEQPTILEMVINKRTADQIGIALAPSLLARADEVID